MSQLWEDPLLVVAAGVLVVALLAVVFYQTGQARVLGAMAGVALLVVLGVLLERVIVTPREEVEATLAAMAAALEAQDADGVLEHVRTGATDLDGRLRQAVADFEITEARVRGLKITLSDDARRPTARAEFVGSLALDARRAQVPYEHYVRRLTVFFEKAETGWQVTGYEDHDLVKSR